MEKELRKLAKMIDHSLLHPTMTDQEMIAGCMLALKHDVASVCIKPYAISLVKDLFAGSDVAVGTVVGFPHGNSRVDVKVFEAQRALEDGAAELDMVVNIGKVLGGDWDYVAQEVEMVNKVALEGDGLLKVIFENDYLSREHIIRLCEICNQPPVAFLKTSTGYGFTKRENGMYDYDGATDGDLSLMREASAPAVEVKAAGGVRTLDDLLRVKDLGVTRVGATATEAILTEARERGYA